MYQIVLNSYLPRGTRLDCETRESVGKLQSKLLLMTYSHIFSSVFQFDLQFVDKVGIYLFGEQ